METHGNKTTSTEKIIYYRKGDESYPRTEDLSKEDWSQYFFSDIYEKAVGIIQDIVQINLLNKRNKDRYNYANNVESTNSLNIRFDISVNNVIPNSYDTRNNIIAFVGERGSGKTSCLQTVYNNIPKIERLRNLQCKFNNHMPIIDPSYFNEHSNILEIVIAQMFQIFKDALQHPEKYFLHDDNLLEKKRNLVKSFQEVKETLDCIDTPIKSSDTNDSVEALSRMAASNNLKQQMEKLIDGYLSYFNGQSESVLVIAIDDLDVQTKHTYTMLEQISKYLIVDRVVILIGVKLKQLSDLIKQNYYNDFEKLINNKEVTGSQIDDMASRYLLKLIPFSHRLFLPNIYDHITELSLEIEGESNESQNLNKCILELIYSRTHISFYNSLEQESLIIPHNLRELLNLIAMLLDLPNVDMKEEPDQRNGIKHNRKYFKRYFINSWCLDKLSSNQYTFIRELDDCDVVQVNKFIMDYLYKNYQFLLKDKDIVHADIFNMLNRSYNVSMADVNLALDILSVYNDINTKSLIFAIKTLYTMMLCEQFHEMNSKSQIERNATELYNRLINSSQKAWQSNNKLSFLSNYERLIGGNILNIDVDVYYSDSNNKYTYVRKNNLNELYNNERFFNYTNKEKFTNERSFGSVNKENFNRIEFHVLTTLVESVNPKYRVYKHCYYDRFPINDFSNTNTSIVSATAVLANIIRLYRLYQLFNFINNNPDIFNIEQIKKTNFYMFFTSIDDPNNKSLIYKILHYDHSNNKTVTEEPKSLQSNAEVGIFRNTCVEKCFFLNIELIGVLENYLGTSFLEKQVNNSINKEWHNFYEKLNNFEYYEYRIKLDDNKETFSSFKYEILQPIVEYLSKLNDNDNSLFA